MSRIRPSWLTAWMLSFGIVVLLGTVASAEEAKKPRPTDITEPRIPAGEGRISKLQVATLITHDLGAIRRFYVDSLGLTLDGPIVMAAADRATASQLWGMPGDLGWDLYRLHRPSVPETVEIRLLVTDRETPAIHDRWDARQPGPFSLGFPAAELGGWDDELRQSGHRANNPMSVYQVPRGDGTHYTIEETIWHAPDFVHAVTIARRDGMASLGPLGADGRGGPVYSGMSIRNSDTALAFYTEVLGFNMRSDRQWKSHGSKGALAVPDGTEFRFSILYAPGSRHGHLLFIDFRDGAVPATSAAPRPPHRGLAMWTFEVRNLGDALHRLKAAGHRPVAGPRRYQSPILGERTALTVLDPGGFLIELVEINEPSSAAGTGH